MPRPYNNFSFAFSLALGMAFSVASALPAQTSRSSSDQSIWQNSQQLQLAQVVAARSVQDSGNNTQLSNKPKTDDRAAKAAEKKPQPVSKERRAELMAFIKTHHPELQPLLKQLQSKREKQFQSALRTLDRNVKNLQSLEKKSPARYQRALNLWVVTSRIQLLSAQLAIKKSDKEKASIRKKIQGLFEEQYQLQREQTQLAVQFAKKRYEKFTQQLKTLEENHDSEIARKLNAIDKAAAKPRGATEKKKSEKKEKPTKQGEQQKDTSEKTNPTRKVKPAGKANSIDKTGPTGLPRKEKTKPQ